MNILRWKRKSGNKIKPKRLLVFIFSLIMTTFAWFAYSKVIEPTLHIHVAAWDVQYYIGNELQTNDIKINIPILYPTMQEKIVTIDIKNNGETIVDIEYNVEKVIILGEEYDLIEEGDAIPTDPTAKYIILTPNTRTNKNTEINPAEGAIITEEIVEGAITNDITKLPFTIETEHTAQVEPAMIDDYGESVSGEGYLKVKVNWTGDTADLDSLWGFAVSEYFEQNPTATSAISIQLTIDAYQAEAQPQFESNERPTEIPIILPSTAETKPYLPTGFTRKPGTNLETGLVIRDPSGNEYVWVEVPKNSTVYQDTELGLTELTEEICTKIEQDLKRYSSAYNTRDDQMSKYQASGVVELNYPTIKNNVLKSIYNNGGFYIGRYEAGIEGSYRTSSSSGTNLPTPVIKANAYPYNFISCSQAQSLASGMQSGEYTSGLMFGFQWDLALKYIDEKCAETAELTTDSTEWGNYKNSIYDLTNLKAKYLPDSISTSTWTEPPYYKEKTDKSIIYTTGGNNLRMKQNIYDLAGNLAEWTLNLTTVSGNTVGGNGGDFSQDGTVAATYRSSTYNAELRYENVGFRVVIY